jgi:hypothetical protein
VTSASHRMGIEVEQFCQLTIATAPQFERLKPGIEAPLSFVKQAREQGCATSK